MSLRILLADESSTIKKAFEIGLNSFGTEIKNVQHGIDVLEVAESFLPDIIFADVLISKMNGYEVCAQIKQHKKLNSIPVVLMWSGFMDIDEDKYFTCQADDKIEKPFSADQLMEVIQNLVQKPIGIRNDVQQIEKKVEFNPQSDVPPALPTHKIDHTPSKFNSVKMSSVKTAPLNPTDDLLLKEDLQPLEVDEDLTLDSSLDPSSIDELSDDFSFDGFKAFDLHDQDSDFSDEYKEITVLPSAEEEQELLNKVKEDTALRYGFNAEDINMDSFDGDMIDASDLPSLNTKENLNSNSLFEDNINLNDDIFGADSNSDTSEFDDIFSITDSDLSTSPKTIHRDVEDIHNSDAGLLISSDEEVVESRHKHDSVSLNKNSSVNFGSSAAVQSLSKEEIKKIVADQAKEMIQSIVWELIPELSKQMIEKEIKRLLAESDKDTPSNSF